MSDQKSCEAKPDSKETKIKEMQGVKRKPLPDGTLPLTESELKELSVIMCFDGLYNVRCVGNSIYMNSKYWDNLIVDNVKAINYLFQRFELKGE